MTAYPFIQARNYTKTGGRSIDLIVVHDMEAPEVPDTASKVALWFAGPTAPNASAHYCIDQRAVIQCVRDQDVAWHAPGANSNGIGLEHAGFANQTSAQWDDSYSRGMLERSAALTADLCTRYKIPVAWLSPADLLAGKRGITSHANVSAAWHRSTHTDPGANFPAQAYVDLVRASCVTAVPVVPIPASPVWTSEEANMLTKLFQVGPLDKDGCGWVDWDPGFGRDPKIIGKCKLGPYPPADGGYDAGDWGWQDKVNEPRVQARGSKVVVSVTGGEPGKYVPVFVTVA